MSFGKESSDQIRKIVKEVTGEYAAVPIPAPRQTSSRLSEPPTRVTIGLSLLLQILVVVVAAAGVVWKQQAVAEQTRDQLRDMRDEMRQASAKVDERLRVQEEFREQTRPILDLMRAKLGFGVPSPGAGRGGR